MRRLLTLAIPVAMMIASAATAQTDPAGDQDAAANGPGTVRQHVFERLDADHDGFVSRREFDDAPRPGPGAATEAAKQRRDARFGQADTDKDGRLSQEEWDALTPRRR